MTKKEFALAQIAPYYKDPSICGFKPALNEKDNPACLNLTADGKMCVAGKNYLSEVRDEYTTGSVNYIFNIYEGDQSKIFIPSSVDILDRSEWTQLQGLHDYIALRFDEEALKEKTTKLGLFTFEELQEAAKNL